MRLYIYLFSFFFIANLKAQEGVPVYFDYLTENYYLVHPSMAGVNIVGGKIRTTIRKQWFDQVEAPNLQTLTADLRLSNRSGLGLTLFNDENGYHSQKGLYLTYAHHINFNDDITLSKRPYPSKDDEIDQLSFGLSVGGIQNTLDIASFDLIDNDPLILNMDDPNTGYFNIDFGMSYVNSKYYAHLTIKNLLFSPHDLYGDFEYDYPRDRTSYKRLVASLGYVFYTETPWSFEPSTLFQLSELTSEKSLDINFKSYYKLNYGRIWAGLSFRNTFEGALYNDSNNNLIEQRLQLITPLLGIDYKDFVFSYNYSHQFGDINFGSGGFHQITIGFNFLRGSIDCDCF